MPSQLGVIQKTLADDTAATLGTIPTGTTQAILVCEDNAIRWRADGTSPTASSGIPMNVGDVMLFVGNDYGDFLRKMEIINQVAGANGAIEGAALTGYDRA
jgi:hypothetical protein